jgi:hypothetical protein
MNISVSCIVPYTLRLKLKGVQVCGAFIVCLSMCATIAAATNVPTDKTDPEIRDGRAIHAC